MHANFGFRSLAGGNRPYLAGNRCIGGYRMQSLAPSSMHIE
ncbi:hypothetical protein RMSM_02194 [Rhodopirellula maiorica SM1]|uniref:Uncharacterized protein n=1 Tax=Rhodopirellula maiorica SM1 TaxID=1265738 RepID=M5RNL2_9BACT|nr:hypothetical protein [Rhodopirellula maiorica]EMI20885.1 hypothetical protein RMSM_02194 [Rhodopirellula maiorica SM1]